MTAIKLDPNDDAAVFAFITANTKLLCPPLVPEIALHLAEESMAIWQRTEDDLGEMNVPPPFWAFAWAGGQALARYLIDNGDICRGRSVADIGSGSGLTAIAAAKTGAAVVGANDIDRIALAACRLNALANDAVFTTNAADLLDAPNAGADIVLIGDLFYERVLADRVLAFIARALAAGSTVLIGDPERSYFPRDRFTRLAEYRVPVTRDLEDAEIKRTAVWQA